jgi:hypothetical protein
MGKILTLMSRQQAFLRISSKSESLLILILLWVLFTLPVQGFTLLGPYADWMDVTNGFRQPGDIGGPMDITEGYRWNVPVVTYGFDQSFLDYFGPIGVAAVEAGISILNGLPPASASVLTNYPNCSQQINYSAAAQGLWDLESSALSALLEQMGLAQPTRYVFSVRQWDQSLEPYAYLDAGLPGATGIIGKFVIERNFDPISLTNTIYVNGTEYTAYIYYGALGTNGIPAFADTVEVQVDPLVQACGAVADNLFASHYYSYSENAAGMFYTRLTYDDVGGLRFLLNTNNLRVEALLPTVHAATTNAGVVNTALRPGMDKITFVPHPFDRLSGSFQTLTNQFTDTYLTNGEIMHQALERVVLQPDILFSADDTGKQRQHTVSVLRTGTANWINNWELNGDTNRLGPGVIVPPVNIVFHQLGQLLESQEPNPEKNAFSADIRWAWFDETMNTLVTFPGFNLGEARPLTLRLRLYPSASSSSPSLISTPSLSYTWRLPVPIGGTVQLQTSTNISAWLPVITVTNIGTVVEWIHNGTSQTNRFFRVVPGLGSN